MKKKIELQILKFGLIGLLNTAVDFGVFTLLTEAFKLDSIISHIISYSCGVINSFYFNRFWTFQKERDPSGRIYQICVCQLDIPGHIRFGVEFIGDKAGVSIYLAKAGAVLCSMAVNFAGSKLIVFKE